ncbi:MAG: ABC transporter permease [Lachnospiraceae bacterium]|nr:ABC transporter permease [Lachnospiraceae bacterium]
MFSMMLHKLIHKKWMVLCLLLGNILLIAVAACYPLYRVSSFQRMLSDEFASYAEENDVWPGTLNVVYTTLKGGAKTGFGNMQVAAENAVNDMGIEVMDYISSYNLATQKAVPGVIRDNVDEKRVTLAAADEMWDHVNIIMGDIPSQTITKDGFIETVISAKAMIDQDILVGDEYTYAITTLIDGSPLKVRVVGVFEQIDENENYWVSFGDHIKENIYMDPILYKECFWGEDKENNYSMSAKWTYIWDYTKVSVSDVSGLINTMEKLDRNKTLGGRLNQGGADKVLNEYSGKAKRIEATLLILQVPVLLLLLAFLYMIAGQMLQMERNEISLLRSRGAAKGQVIGLYFMQSVFLSTLSLIPGLPLAGVFCKLLGSSTAFLEFSARRSLDIKFTGDIIIYAFFAVLLSVIMTTIPVIGYSGLSIVKLKQSKSRSGRSLWKKMYLDIILLAISGYGYYSFSKNENMMVMNVLSGESLDPLLYVSFSLFILGAGLFCARLQPYLLKAFFAITKKRLKPSTYASLLGSIRTGAKQEFIILFMILTVSIGISDTMIARTIVSNAVNNTRHIVGADIVLKEKWGDNSAYVQNGQADTLTYIEPDFSKFETIEGVNSATKVVYDTGGKVPSKKVSATIMGIKTSGFYKVTTMADSLNPYSYEEYLNVLASDPQAVLLSENFLTKQDLHIGDVITYENAAGKTAVGYVYGFFKYWPTYSAATYSLNTDGTVDSVDNYMVVTNYSYLVKRWGVTPYQVWLDTSDDGDGFYAFADENASTLRLTKLESMAKEEEAIIEDTMFQGTNGILSMSFIVILLLCVVGYLIYWIMSIKSRELLFGVLRAMGMRKREINWLLIVEQICSGLFAIVTGGFIGILSSNMFVPMIQKAYAASEQVLPLKLITQSSDMIQLFAVIGAVLAICLVVLARIVSTMNISNALKLGED